MSDKYLDEKGLERLWGNFKESFPHIPISNHRLDVITQCAKLKIVLTKYIESSTIVMQQSEPLFALQLNENLQNISIDKDDYIAFKFISPQSFIPPAGYATGLLTISSENNYICLVGSESHLDMQTVVDEETTASYPSSGSLIYSLNTTLYLNADKIYTAKYIDYQWFPDGTTGTWAKGWLITNELDIN